MTNVKWILSLSVCSLLLGSHSALSESAFYVTPEFSQSRLEVDDQFLPLGFQDDITVQGLHVSAGYRLPFNVVLEGGIGHAENLTSLGSTFDNYELTERRLALGFSLPISENFRVESKAGTYRWRLRGEEGQFLNQGSEDDITSKGSDSFWQIDFHYMYNDTVGLNFSGLNQDMSFGRVWTIRVGARFEFKPR